MLLNSGCRKSYSLNEEQSIFFHYEYIKDGQNTAHNGFYIDNEGSVLSYSDPEDWNFHDESLSISKEDLAENLSRCFHSGFMVPDKVLSRYSGYIPNIASSKITAVRNTGTDKGTIRFICYQYDKYSDCYHGTLIRTEGDFTQENLNFYSKKIISWLKDISINIETQQ